MKQSSLMSSISPELAEVIAEAYRRESDPLAILVAHAYFFSGLSINTIRGIVTVSDNFGVLRVPSKELIRRMITSVRDNIFLVTRERYGENVPYDMFANMEQSSIGDIDSILQSIDALDDSPTTSYYSETP